MPDKADIAKHLPLVRRIARQIKNMIDPPLEVDELVSLGVLGLGEALDRYRPEAGVRFEAFAHYRIRGAILEGISRQCPVSRHVYRRIKLRQKADEHMEGVGRDLAGARKRSAGTDAALIASTVRDLASIYTMARATRIRHDDGSTTIDIEDPSAREEHERRVSLGEIRALVGRLPDDQARLIELYYFEDRTLEEAGRALGVKKSWACKLHQAALRRMRDMMGPGRTD